MKTIDHPNDVSACGHLCSGLMHKHECLSSSLVLSKSHFFKYHPLFFFFACSLFRILKPSCELPCHSASDNCAAFLFSHLLCDIHSQLFTHQETLFLQVMKDNIQFSIFRELTDQGEKQVESMKLHRSTVVK